MEHLVAQFPQIMYGTFAALAILAGFAVITAKNPVASAFSLIIVLLNVAGIFALQEAHFVAAVTILVYAGAIMVLFVFVIMLLSIDSVELDFPSHKGLIVPPAIISLLLFALLGATFLHGTGPAVKGPYTTAAISGAGGNIRVVSEVMFSDYMIPFQLSGLTLMIAVVGAVVLAKRRVE
jgi:NADH-quinone oxidoreductase subunit J